MVEARGVEPLSETPSALASTRLAGGRDSRRALARPQRPLSQRSVVSHRRTRSHGPAASLLGDRPCSQQASEFGRCCQLSSKGKLVRVCSCLFERLFRRPADQPPRAASTSNIPSKPERPHALSGGNMLPIPRGFNREMPEPREFTPPLLLKHASGAVLPRPFSSASQVPRPPPCCRNSAPSA